MNGVRRYLSNFVVTADGVKRLAVVEVSAGRLSAIEPFVTETASTLFVPGILVVASGGLVDVAVLRGMIKESIAATAQAVADALSVLHGSVPYSDGVGLYAIDVAANAVSVVFP